MSERWQKPFTAAEIAAMRRAARDEQGAEARVTGEFWQVMRRVWRHVPFAEDAIAGFLCATDPASPPRVRGILLMALAYFVMPFDIIPDFIPFFGFTDDAAVIGAAIAAVRNEITPEHWRRAKEILGSEMG